ncbi:ATP-dependent DNA ligase LigA [Halopenitus persicus]|uniref:DNA ligase n=1 Tax=Halopenitus persicus TaxID=1048396 RepID=A0A1H3HHZ5_9EURY|nr:ATP-dependent DNA ligase LigA [Halopenitus persicus]SDY15097.1 DNA ligase-1 [Halopenitus persicus]
MEFAAFAARAEAIEETEADHATTVLVAALLADADGDLETVVRFLLGRVFPAHETRTLDVGPALCREAIAKAAGPNVDTADVEDRLADRGEIGAVAASYDFGGQRGLAAFGAGNGTHADGDVDGSGPTVADVDGTLRSIAAAAGDGSEGTKLDTLFGLFNRIDPPAAKILARLVLGEMRLGVGEGTVRDAIAEAFLATDAATPSDAGASGTDGDGRREDAGQDDENGEPVLTATDEDVAAVERALQVTNDYGRVAAIARDRGRPGLADQRLVVGRPVQAMLAQAGTAADALAEWDRAAVETKFDGARVQVHYAPSSPTSPGSTASTASAVDATDGIGPKLYSRNMDDVTAALPEVVELVASRVDVPVILDGEVVAVDEDGDPLPFQEVLRRFRRKHDVDRMREEVDLRFHAFDCLHAGGEDLLEAPLETRHDRLREVVPDLAATLTIADDVETIETIERRALDAGHEGIMLKNPDSPYTPGDRGKNWLKRKPDVETLDLVVTGGEWGEGRRASLFGTFEVSVRVDRAGDGEEAVHADRRFEPVGKVATGITDERLASLTDQFEPLVRSEEGTTVTFDPAVVFEVGYEEIQRSPTYGSGYALRFPRFVGVREDKDVTDADTLERLERLADAQ